MLSFLIVFFRFFSFRLELLESHLLHLEQFDQALLTLTQRSEILLSDLRNSSQVHVNDVESAFAKLKVNLSFLDRPGPRLVQFK